MHQLLKRLAQLWKEQGYPRLMSFVATAGFAWLGICLLLIFGLAQLADEVLEQEAFAFDETILLWIHQFSTPWLDQVMLNHPAGQSCRGGAPDVHWVELAAVETQVAHCRHLCP
jgi:hypothetical protein